jgi:hypothetical protein
VDARNRRIRSREEIAADPSVNVYRSQEQGAAEAEEAAVAQAVAPEERADELDLDDLDSVLAEPAAVRAPTLTEREAVAKASGGTQPTADSALRAKRKGSPDAFPKSEGTAALGGTSSAGQAVQAAGRENVGSRDDALLRAEASTASSPRPAKPASSASDEMLSALSEDSNAASTRSAAEKKEAVSSLDRARQLRAASGCAAAVPAYQQATKEAASRGTALIELALCQRKLGQESIARTLLEQATAVPAVAATARSLLSAPKSTKAATTAEPAAEPARN